MNQEWIITKPDDNRFYWRVRINTEMIQFQHWTDEQPGEHFKAHDLRLFGGYDDEYQSFQEFLENPWMPVPDEVYDELSKIIQEKSPEEMAASQKKRDEYVRYVWVPVDQDDQKKS